MENSKKIVSEEMERTVVKEAPKVVKESLKVVNIYNEFLTCVDEKGNGRRILAKEHKNAKIGDTIKV